MKRIWLFLAFGLVSSQALGNGETLSPNMGLVVPAVGVTTGPDWASDIDASLQIIDQHNHCSGSGVQIPSCGLNINADLTFLGNNLTDVNSVVFDTVTGTPSNLGIYTNGTDLFYKDSSGSAIQITRAHGVNVSAGNIQNLPSTPTGGAGISWSNSQSTFQFFKDSGVVGANIDFGTMIIRYPGSYPTPAGNYIAFEAPASLATGYALTLPATLAAANGSLLTSSTSGALSYSVVDGSTLQSVGGTLAVKAGGITITQMAANSVGTTQLVDANVTLAKMATNSVGTTQIVDLAVTQVKKERRTAGTSTAAVGGVAQAGLSLTTSSTTFVSAGQCTLTTNGGVVVITLSAISGTTAPFYFANVTQNSPTANYMQYRVVGNNGSDHELGRYSVHAPAYAAGPNDSSSPFVDAAPGTVFIGKPFDVTTPDTWTFRLEMLVNTASQSAVIDNWLISAYEL